MLQAIKDEKKAEFLMQLNRKIFDKLKINSGGQIYNDNELALKYTILWRKVLKDNKITSVGEGVQRILESENYHIANTVISNLGIGQKRWKGMI